MSDGEISFKGGLRAIFWSLLVGILVPFAWGVVLSLCGIHFPDWRFNLLMGVFIVSVCANRALGWYEQRIWGD